MDTAAPDLAGLKAAVAEFAAYSRPDQTWATLLAATAPSIDPGQAGHRTALHAWLNAWGCRIRYPREGEPDVFSDGLAAWWDDWSGRLPSPELALADLDDAAISGIGECFAALSAMPAALAKRPRPLGPTAAAKLFFALRPLAVMPWDEAIALRLHGARDGAAFAAHQALGRDWAQKVAAEAQVSTAGLPELLGRPERPLTKILDDYCYLVFTRDAAGQEVSQDL
ncbi:hypothetical protein [Longispora albida]|uniref:hypothetical protein n=1 Tax=Longispora albida TaxID=203523 RepID=UPI000374E77A|nr:hypothetical protein [Longispora albida]